MDTVSEEALKGYISSLMKYTRGKTDKSLNNMRKAQKIYMESLLIEGMVQADMEKKLQENPDVLKKLLTADSR